MELKDRITKLKEHFKLNNAELGRIAEVSGQAISDIETGTTTNPRVSVFQKIASKLDINLTWLVFGSGDMLPDQNPAGAPAMQVVRDDTMPKVVTVDSQGRDNVVFVPIAAKAGYLAGYADPEYFETLPTYRLPNLHNGTYRMFQIEGQSMYPTLKHGDIVVAEWVEKLEDIRNERVHVLVTKTDGIVIKRAINAINRFGYVIAKSDNANKGEYPNIEINPNDIKEIWYARGFFSFTFPAPADTYVRLTNVEIELEAMKKAFQKFLNQ